MLLFMGDAKVADSGAFVVASLRFVVQGNVKCSCVLRYGFLIFTSEYSLNLDDNVEVPSMLINYRNLKGLLIIFPFEST